MRGTAVPPPTHTTATVTLALALTLIDPAIRNTTETQVVGAKAEEVLGESARDLHVPQTHWTEALLEGHEQFVKTLKEMGERAAPIVDKVKKREELVQVCKEGVVGERGS